MIITAWYLDQKVLLGVPDGSLVYDGRIWTTPNSAKNIALTHVAAREVTATLPIKYQTAYEEPAYQEPPALEISLTFNNLFICKVLSVSTGVLPQDVLSVPAPAEFCLCGVTCVGTELKYVLVFE